MWHFIVSYIKYFIKSKSKYRIHSPFVYHLITTILEPKIPQSYTKRLLQYRAELHNDSNTIQVTDYGAGSRIFKSNTRAISAIAKNAGISSIKAFYLQKLVYHLKPKSILEVGTSLGIGTAAMSIAHPNANITTLEGCPETSKVTKSYFKKFGLTNIKLIVGEFSNTLPKVLQNNTFDLIYFDGNHQKEATINYFLETLEHLHNDSFCIFDDIHWSKGMEEAWEYIKKHPKATVTIDLFHFGIVFYRKEQEAQNFIIRI